MKLDWRPLTRHEVARDRLAAIHRGDPPRTLAERVRRVLRARNTTHAVALAIAAGQINAEEVA